MALGGGRGLTSVDAQRWLRGLRLFRVERLLLILIFLVLAAVSFLVPGDVGCTAADPRVCGPSLPGTWALALAFATPILLLSGPALGCLSAVALAVLGARYDPGPVSHGWWAAGGILSVALLAHLTLTRISTQLLRPRQLNSKWRRRPCHQGTVVSAGRLAWRRTGEYARRSMRTVIWSPLMLMVPELSRKRRWRVSGVAVA